MKDFMKTYIAGLFIIGAFCMQSGVVNAVVAPRPDRDTDYWETKGEGEQERRMFEQRRQIEEVNRQTRLKAAQEYQARTKAYWERRRQQEAAATMNEAAEAEDTGEAVVHYR